MPAKHDNKPLSDPFLDDRVRILPCQMERMIRLRDSGLSYGKIAEKMGVTPSAVRYKLNPDAAAANRKARDERGGSARYYDRETTVDAVRKLREKKKKLFK